MRKKQNQLTFGFNKSLVHLDEEITNLNLEGDIEGLSENDLVLLNQIKVDILVSLGSKLEHGLVLVHSARRVHDHHTLSSGACSPNKNKLSSFIKIHLQLNVPE